MIAANLRHEGFVHFMPSELVDICGERRAFEQMARRVFVTAASGMIEREFDHGSERQHRRKGCLPARASATGVNIS